MAGNHARFAPSGAKKWAYCLGALELEDTAMSELIACGAFPKGTTEWPSTDDADEGSFAHGVLERCLTFGIDPMTAGALDDEMEDAVQLALDYVYTRAFELRDPDTGDPAMLQVESKVHIAEDCWGTKDISIHWHDGIEVIDFKYGEGVFVEIEGCDQLELYMIGVLMGTGSKSITDPGWECDTELMTTIIQPRIPLGHHYYHQETLEIKGPIRSTTLTMEYLRGRLGFFIDAMSRQGPSFAPSRETCRWCNAKGICKAATDHALELAQLWYPDLEPEGYTVDSIEGKTVAAPSELNMDERTIILANVELIRAQLKAVEGHALEIALNGIQVKGEGGEFKVVRSSGGQRKFDCDDAEMVKVFKSRKVKKADYTTFKLISPAQTEKLGKRMMKQNNLSQRQFDAIMAHVITPPGKRTLVPLADARPAIALTAEQMFSDVKPEGEIK